MSIRLDSALRATRLALPALATGLLAFNAGGFFAGTTALAACVLCLALVLRLTIADRPWEGWSAALAVASGAGVALAAWMLVSSAWSDSAGRALLEFDRALLYVLALVLGGLFVARPVDLSVLLRWLAAVLVIICVASLLTRLAPDAFPSDRAFTNDRLTFPLTYWNGMGILAALALVLCAHLASSARESAAVRVLAAMAVPAVAVTLYFTFSRGGIAAAIVGVAAYLVLGHPRGLLPALVAVVPVTVYALSEAYGADLLATGQFADPVAAGQREHVVRVVAGCMAAGGLLRALGLVLDRRLADVRVAAHVRGRLWLVAVAAAALAVAVVSVATDLPRRLDEERREFSRGAILPGSSDLRERLTQTGNNGRIANWRVARDAFAEHPVRGTGAGTYRLLWEEDRPRPAFQVNDGHSLYLETAAELGLVGLVLLAVTLLTPLVVAATRLRGPEHDAIAAFLAAGGALLLHAAVDWDWELPVLFVWYFAAAGIVLAAREPRSPVEPGRMTRLLGGLACLVVLLTPAFVVASQGPLDRSVTAFSRGDCRAAVDAALDSLDVLRVRPEPYEILGYCDVRAGQRALAVRAMRSAQRRDPGNWQYAYGLAIVQALNGEDPRAAAGLARRLNPLEELAVDLERRLRPADPERRRRVAATADIPFQ